MIYEFKKDDALSFRNHLRVKAKERHDELQFDYCPYCHGGKRKDKGTFSISLDTGQFECKRSSCGVKGNMITLARDFNFNLSEDVSRYYNVNDYNNRFKKFKAVHKQSTDPAIKYLQDRGISEEVCKAYEITTKEGDNNILVFPFRNETGELKFIKYRKMNFKKGKDKSKEWCEADCMPILFGMDKCVDFDKLIVTEGQIDSLSVRTAGVDNVVSVPTGANGFTWIPHCWDWLVQFKELVVFGDCEHGKVTLSEELGKRFPGKVSIVRIEDYKDCKDANELLQKHGKRAVTDAVVSAKQVDVERVKDLADVKAVDLYSIPKIKTNIKSIDDLIGGFYLGQVILLTGKRGEGKSTLMSQFICEATEQGYNSFVYSGELKDFYFKNWLDSQLAGDKNIMVNDRGGYISHYVRQSHIDKMNDWYRGKIKLYDNEVIEEDEMEGLLDIMEKAICQYDLKLICIDNLMTALEVDAKSDLYRAQSKFVGRLTKIAKKYDVVILLVAHPRKTSLNISNDDISGSADITNRVDLVMSYGSSEEIPEHERYFQVMKNRLTGKVTRKNKEIRLLFSEFSKRIIDSHGDFQKAYSWEGDTEEFYETEDLEVPF